jgi:hypothetical protein
MNTIDRITIRRMLDTDPDLSFLTDSDRYTGCTEEEAAKYEKEDAARLKSYGTAWYMIGIRAESRIKVRTNAANHYSTLQTIRSGGLWGIESDSDDSHLEQVTAEELAELKIQLEALNVSLDNWTTAVEQAKTAHE